MQSCIEKVMSHGRHAWHLALLKLPDAEGGVEGAPKIMSSLALGALDKSNYSGEDDVDASYKASILTSFSLAHDQIISLV